MWRRLNPSDREARLARNITLALSTVFLLLICRWRPWDLFARGGFSSDFYDAQAHAFLHLRLDVPESVASLEGFSVGGKTYIYFGPMLALVRLPIAVFGHTLDGRLTRLSMVGAFATMCTATFHFGRHVATLVGATTRSHRRVPMLVAATAASPALALAGVTAVYHETELWAMAGMLSTLAALAAFRAASSTRYLRLAVLASWITVLTRSSVGLGAVAAVMLTALLHLRKSRGEGLRAVGCSAVALGASMLINFVKFRSVVDLPWARQWLTLHDPDRAAWFARNGGSFISYKFVPTTVFHYMRPDAVRVERLLPFVRFGPLAREIGGTLSPGFGARGLLESNTPSASLTSAATLLFVAAVLGVVMIIRRCYTFVVPWIVGTAVAIAPTLMIGFIANRYLIDLLPALVVPAAVAVAVWRPRRVSIAQPLVVVLVAWGTWCNAALAIWMTEFDNPGFTSLRYRLDDLVFGGRPPALNYLTSGAPVPHYGALGVSGECEGLYISARSKWIALERAEGVRQVNGTLQSDQGLMFTSPDGELSVHRDNGQVFIRWSGTDGATTDSRPAALAIGSDVEIISDPVDGGFTVTIDGHWLMLRLDAPDLAHLTPGPSLRINPPAADRGTPICTRLTGMVAEG